MHAFSLLQNISAASYQVSDSSPIARVLPSLFCTIQRTRAPLTLQPGASTNAKSCLNKTGRFPSWSPDFCHLVAQDVCAICDRATTYSNRVAPHDRRTSDALPLCPTNTSHNAQLPPALSRWDLRWHHLSPCLTRLRDTDWRPDWDWRRRHEHLR